MRWLCTHLDARGFPCNHETAEPLSRCGIHRGAAEPEPVTEPCRECDRPARAAGLCDTHYRQARKYGETRPIQYHPRQQEAA